MYSLPSDFIKLNLVRYNDSKLARTDRIDILAKWWEDNTGTPSKYYVYWNNLWLYPTPTSAVEFDIIYYKRLAELTSGQDSQLPVDFDDAICLYATYIAFNSVNKLDAAKVAFTDYQLNINTLLSSYIYEDMDVSYKTQRYGNTDLSTDTL